MCVALAIALALIVHTPPVRRAVLARVVTLLADSFDVALRADALSYNLLALRITVTGLEVAATHTPQTPVLTADRLEVVVPRSALFGALSLDYVGLQNARVMIERDADGRLNLPESEGEPGEPQAVPIGRVDVPHLAISVTDRVQDFSLTLPAIALDIGPAEGSVQLTQPGGVRQGDTAITISRLGGGLAYDGRAIGLTAFGLTTQQGSVDVDGRVALLVDEPRADLHFTASGDLARILGFVPDAPPASGLFGIEGSVMGPLAGPDIRLRVRSDALRWEGLTASDVDASLGIDGSGVHLSRFGSGIAGGRVSAAGDLVNGEGLVDLGVTWEDIDLDALLRALGVNGVRPAATTDGTAALRGAGADLTAWTIDVKAQLDPTRRAAGRIAVAGEVELGARGGQWMLDLDGVVERAPVRAALGGRLDGGSLMASTVGGEASVADVDLPIVLASLREAGLVDTEPEALTAGRLDANVGLAGTFAAPRLDLTATARDVAASGVSDLNADVNATGTLRELAVDVRIRQASDNAVAAVGTVSPEASRADLRVTGTFADWSVLPADVPVRGTAAIDLRVHGPFDAIAAQGTIAVPDAAYSDIDIGGLLASIDASTSAVAVEVTSAELATRATGTLSLTGERRAVVQVQVQEADLERLTRDAGAPLPITGRISLAARADAPLDDWQRGRAELDLTRLDIRAGDLPVRLSAPARVTYEDGLVDVVALDAEVGETRLSIAGRLASESAAAVQPADALRALLVGDIAGVIAAVEATGLTTIPDLSARGSLALLARVTGPMERPSIAADLDIGMSELAVEDIPAIRIGELRASLVDGWIEQLAASAEWQDSRLRIGGRVPLRLFGEYLPAAVVEALPATSGPARLEVRAESMTPAMLSPFLEADALAQIDGVIDASARLEADALDPGAVRGDLRLDRLDVRLAGLPVTQQGLTRIEIGNGIARVAAWEWTGQGATLNVQGEIGLTSQQAAILAAGAIDLRLLTPFVRTAGVSIAGTLAPRFSISGSLADPRIDGELALSGAEIRLAEPRVIATNVSAFTVLSPDRARLMNLSGEINGGTLSGTGEAQFGSGVSPSVRLGATITGMGLEFPEGLRSELNVDLVLAVAQPQDEPAGGTLSGTVTVVRSAYREPLAVATGLLTAMRTEQAVAAQADPDGFANRLALDIRVGTDSDVIVDNNLARLQLGGDLRVIGTAAAPGLSGRAALREGGQLFLGRNVYTIESGTIDFTDPDAIVPELNVLARTRAGGHEIELMLTGTPEELDLALSAPESGLGQADVASLLLTGRELEDVSGAEGDIVREQLVSYLSGDVLALAGRAIGFDSVRLGGPDTSTIRRDPAAVAAEADPTSRLTFGKLIGDDIELTYSQSLRDGGQTWIVDYRPIAQINLRLVSDDDNLRAYEFRHDLSFGGGRRSRPPRPPEAVAERVVQVIVTSDGSVPEAPLRDALRLEEGDRFDFAEWQRDRDRIEARLRADGRLEARVTADREQGDGGVALAYDVAAGPLTSLSVSGYTLSGRARADIEEAWTQSIFDDFLREEAEGIVRAALAADGFLEPGVSSVMVTGETKTLQITVEPGERARQRRVAVTASGEITADAVESWLAGRGLATSWDAPDDLQAALLAELRSRGHMGAEVRTERPRVESGVAVLPVIVEAGPLFRLGEVTFSGAGKIPEERLRDQASLSPGDPYTGIGVDAARQRVGAVYRRDGFPAARVTATPAVDRESQRVAVAFVIEEGPQQVLREVTVVDNRSIDADVITRAIDVDAGEPVGADTWLQARSRLFDTGLFRRVDVTVEPLEQETDAEQRPVQLRVVVEEWPALRLRYGLQVAERRPEDALEGRDLSPGLSADVTRRTLFGRAISVGAAAELQRRERLARVFVSTPTFIGLPVESMFTAERSHRDFADQTFVTDIDSLAWEQRVRIGRTWQLSYNYRFNRDHTYDTGVPDDPFNPVFDVAVNVARLTGSAVFDTRDDPTETTRGWLMSGNVELAPSSLGSDVSFVRQLGQAYHFRPVGPVVLASAGRFGLVVPRAGQTVLLSELFRAGGARTVRGVGEEVLGPSDFFGPTGGQAVVVMNQEVRFPIYRWVRGVGFFDAGNVFAEPGEIDFRRLVTTYGAGLRVVTPFALLRIDYGRLWTNKDDLSPVQWTFGIGHTF